MTVRLIVCKDYRYPTTPHFSTTAVPPETYYCTTGVDAGTYAFFRCGHGEKPDLFRFFASVDIREATRAAVRNMIDFLCGEFKMTRVEAYMLCSVACDLRIHEVVRGVLFIIPTPIY